MMRLPIYQWLAAAGVSIDGSGTGIRTHKHKGYVRVHTDGMTCAKSTLAMLVGWGGMDLSGSWEGEGRPLAPPRTTGITLRRDDTGTNPDSAPDYWDGVTRGLNRVTGRSFDVRIEYWKIPQAEHQMG